MADEKSRSSVGAVVKEIDRMSLDDETSDTTSDSIQTVDSEGATALIVTKVNESVFEGGQSQVRPRRLDTQLALSQHMTSDTDSDRHSLWCYPRTHP